MWTDFSRSMIFTNWQNAALCRSVYTNSFFASSICKSAVKRQLLRRDKWRFVCTVDLVF
jgi:hypothetical protein